MEHGGHTVVLNDLLQTDFKDIFNETLNSYPIFDEEYRQILNDKIVNHYRFREIGFYSPDKFNYKLYVKLNEILPFYNTLYKKLYTENFDLFNAYDFTETYDSTNGEISESDSKNLTKATNDINASGTSKDNTTTNGTSNNTQTFDKGTQKSKILNSDTPQGNINIANIDSGGYLSGFTQTEQSSLIDTTKNNGSNESKSISDSSFTNTSKGSNNSENTGKFNTSREGVTNYIRKVTGYQGRDNIEMLNKYTKSMLNIDLLIIKELKDLFFMFY